MSIPYSTMHFCKKVSLDCSNLIQYIHGFRSLTGMIFDGFLKSKDFNFCPRTIKNKSKNQGLERGESISQ
jgi:hypothetical protein